MIIHHKCKTRNQRPLDHILLRDQVFQTSRLHDRDEVGRHWTGDIFTLEGFDTNRSLKYCNKFENNFLSVVLLSLFELWKEFSEGAEKVRRINWLFRISNEELLKDFLILKGDSTESRIFVEHEVMGQGRCMSQTLHGDIKIAGIS